MIMTHYMELLSLNQPWNLILFMVIPVGLAETLVATEFFTLYLGEGKNRAWRLANKYIGMLLGLYFLGVVFYLAMAVLPSIEWRGWVDKVSVYAYMLGVIPLFAITLMEWNVFGSKEDRSKRVKQHALLLIAFLVVSHVAMIFGMADPQLGGWKAPVAMDHSQMDHSQMNHSQMNHSE
jgi:hypothetical protein